MIFCYSKQQIKKLLLTEIYFNNTDIPFVYCVVNQTYYYKTIKIFN